MNGFRTTILLAALTGLVVWILWRLPDESAEAEPATEPPHDEREYIPLVPPEDVQAPEPVAVAAEPAGQRRSAAGD